MHDQSVHVMLETVVVSISVGVLLMVLARAARIPAIIALLAGGILFGPQVLGIFDPESLNSGLRVVISLAVGLILFEGGLTLDWKGYQRAGIIIRRLLSVGLLTTFVLVTAAIWLVFRYDLGFCMLAASLVVVTGPTVIGPLLKKIKVMPNVHNTLHWEGVLIDPLGVFLALLCYEWIVGHGSGAAISAFLLRVAEGIPLGIAGGFALVWVLHRRVIPEDMVNVFTLAWALGIFGLAEWVIVESGLLAVTVCGFVIGARRPPELRQIKAFKAEVTDLLIAMVFMLLAARLEFAQFVDFGWRGVLLVAIVMVVVRPAAVFLSSAGLGTPWRERLFLSWVAPRGIVAASMASLFALSLEEADRYANPSFLMTFTFSVIIATVVIQGFTAGPLAGLLGLRRPAPTGWLVVGAHPLARRVAAFLSRGGEESVRLLDVNARAVREAKDEGLDARVADARDVEALGEALELDGIGNLLALTDNEDLNMLLCQRWMAPFGRDHVHRWDTPGAKERQPEDAPGAVVWPALPKPSLLSAEIARGEALLSTEPALAPAARNATTLAAIAGAQVLLDPASQTALDPATVSSALVLRRSADYLTRSLRDDLAARLDATTPEQLFRLVLERVVHRNPRVPLDHLLGELVEREKSFPTALGHGVAVPHAYSAQLSERLCAVVQVPGGLDFSAPDGEPVRLAFVLLSPSGDPEGHLATMGEIARLVADKAVRAELMAAEDPADMLLAIRRARAQAAGAPRPGR